VKRVLSLLISVFLVTLNLYAEVELNRDSTSALENNKTTQKKESVNKKELENIKKRREEVRRLQEELDKVDKELNSDIMYSKYNNHQIYLHIKNSLEEIKKKIDRAKRFKKDRELSELNREYMTLSNQLALLEDFKEMPFVNLTKPADIKPPPKVESPFSIFSAFTYMKMLKKHKDEYKNELDKLLALINKLEKKDRYLNTLSKIYGENYKKGVREEIKKELDEIIASYDIANSTNKLYNKKVDDTIAKLTVDVKEQIKKLFNIAIVILVILFLSFIFKYFAKKTISDNQRYYMAHKVINFTNLILISLVLLFSFLENATYLVTVLGFASAGIAIAMKDLFMSLLGWIVIVFGGSFHVGDRVKVYKGGHSYVGDIVDISFLRMTILEDVTLTTVTENFRAGRIIFIPNNYVFTELLANYTHGKIKTVWDGVEIMVTFDSNHKKAAQIVREIVKKYSKGYTDISRKQLNALRNQYSLKNINVDPRIYTFIESYGIRISCWYMTNSYATLTLRSNIFSNIIDEINKQEDIKIAYQTQIINIKRDRELPKFEESGEGESIS
jgi:small-conductance mechanosensitive channel